MKYLTVLVMLVTISPKGIAQDENSKNIIGRNTGNTLFRVGLETSTISYINTKTKDSSGVALYIAPYIDYNHKSGLGVSLKSYALPGGSNPGFYLTTISPYFARYDGKLLPYISYTRYIQHNNPSVPYSPIQNEFYAHLRLKTRYIDPVAGIDFGFGKDNQNNNESVSDINAFVGMSHLFVKENLGTRKSHAFGIRPLLQLNAGTNRYFEFLRTTNYLSHNTMANRMGYSGGRGNGNSGNGTPMTQNVSTINEFNVSNIEANLYVIYFYGRLSIEPSGSLYFPLRENDQTPYGYWQINLNFWIK